jgi:hypothetical protein
MTVDTPATAFAAVAVLMVGADKVGTMEEHDFIFGKMSGLDVFAGMDEGAFNQLITKTTDEVCASYPLDGLRVTDEGVDSLARSIRDALTPDLCVQAVQMAVDLASVDGMTSEEERLVVQLCDGFDLDRSLVQGMLGQA